MRLSPVLRKLISVMVPILIAQLSTVGMNFLDTAMSGHAGKVDLAGVSVGASLFMPILVATTGVLAAATPMIAQHLGKKGNGGHSGNNAHRLLCGTPFVCPFRGELRGGHRSGAGGDAPRAGSGTCRPVLPARHDGGGLFRDARHGHAEPHRYGRGARPSPCAFSCWRFPSTRS